MKTLFYCTYLLFLTSCIYAQKGIVNNGANIKLLDGAFIYVDGNTDGNLYNNSGGTTTINSWLTLEGDIINEGSIILEQGASVLENAASGSGQTILNLSVDNENPYLFSSSVSGLTAGNFTNCILKQFSEGTDSLVSMISTDSLAPGKGFRIESTEENNMLELSGSLFTGSLVLPLSYSGYGWNLLGNPYPSSINWNDLVAVNKQIDKALYGWNGYNYTYYLANSGLTLNGGNPVIEPNNAFFVKTENSGNLEFNNSLRLHPTSGTVSSTKSLGEYLKIGVNEGSYSDELLINFIPEASESFDSEYDAHKILFGENLDVPQVYTKSNNIYFAINSLSSTSIPESVILCFQANVDGTYTLEFEDGLSTIDNLYIKDNLHPNSNPVSLNLTSTFPFEYSTTNTPERFILYFNYSSTGFEDNLKPTQWQVYSNHKTVYIKLNYLQSQYIKFNIYNILGEPVYQGRANNGINTYSLDRLRPGAYIVSAIINGQPKSEKIIIY